LLKRVKRRYLAIEIDADAVFSSKEFIDAVWAAILKLYGEYGGSMVGLTLIDFEKEKGFAVIRVMLTALEVVRTALGSITKIGDRPVVVHVLRVSGTLKALYKNVARQPRSV
jgi:RNase P/RNase MRP subunit POP5